MHWNEGPVEVSGNGGSIWEVPVIILMGALAVMFWLTNSHRPAAEIAEAKPVPTIITVCGDGSKVVQRGRDVFLRQDGQEIKLSPSVTPEEACR